MIELQNQANQIWAISKNVTERFYNVKKQNKLRYIFECEKTEEAQAAAAAGNFKRERERMYEI